MEGFLAAIPSIAVEAGQMCRPDVVISATSGRARARKSAISPRGCSLPDLDDGEKSVSAGISRQGQGHAPVVVVGWPRRP